MRPFRVNRELIVSGMEEKVKSEPHLVRLGLLSAMFALMENKLYLIVRVAKWRYIWTLSEINIFLLRQILDRKDDGKHCPTPEFRVTGELGYARAETHKPCPPLRHSA